MKLKIKCQECRGEGCQEYDNEIGHAVQCECSTCEGKGHFIIDTVTFHEFAEAFSSFNSYGATAVPSYDESLVLNESFLPFQLHMRFMHIGHYDLMRISRISDSIGMEANIEISDNAATFYFTNK